jgi:hypothetical protein
VSRLVANKPLIARDRHSCNKAGYRYQVDVGPTSITITNESFAVIATIIYTVVVGDVFRIELSSGFRLYINGELKHERVSGFGTPIRYPASYFGQVTNQVVGARPAVPAPRLSGNWQLGGGAEFIAPSQGSLTATSFVLETEYFGGNIPGLYDLVAFIDPGVESWMEDSTPAGATQQSANGDAWNFVSSNPSSQFGALSHKSNNVAGDHVHFFTGATATLQISKDDILYCWVFPDTVNPTTEIMLEWNATDATGFEHRAYWGANSLSQGTDGTPSRRRMGAVPPAGQWTRLEVPASLVDMEGRVANGMSFRLFGGRCSFDQCGRFPGAIQRAKAIIKIAPLEVLGDATRTIQPGAKTRIQTNYDNATTALITLSILSGGGSLSQGEFTAPSAPGTTVIRVASSAGNQTSDVNIEAPAILTPDFFAVAPLEVVDWNTNIVSPTFSSIPSGINSGTGVWTAPSVPGQKVLITATDGTFTVTREVLIIDKFPFRDFSLPISWDRNLSALVSMSEDRTSRITREKAPPYDSYPVKLTSRTLADSNAVDEFFDAKGFGKPFILEDKVRGIRKVGWFDSRIRHEARDECDIDLSFQFLEARI